MRFLEIFKLNPKKKKSTYPEDYLDLYYKAKRYDEMMAPVEAEEVVFEEPISLEPSPEKSNNKIGAIKLSLAIAILGALICNATPDVSDKTWNQFANSLERIWNWLNHRDNIELDDETDPLSTTRSQEPAAIILPTAIPYPTATPAPTETPTPAPTEAGPQINFELMVGQIPDLAGLSSNSTFAEIAVRIHDYLTKNGYPNLELEDFFNANARGFAWLSTDTLVVIIPTSSQPNS